MKKLKNLSKIRVKGLNQERSISKICKSFKLFNLNRLDKSLSELEVKNSDLKKVKAQFLSEGLEVEVLSSNGISYQLKKLFKNYGIIAACLLSIAFYIFQFNFVLQVKVYGTEKLNNVEIVEFINENFSKNKHKIQTNQIEISLKEKFPRISSVSVAIVGQSLVVNVYENYYPPELEGNFKPIIAEVDCKINSIQLIQGTLAIKVGDIVQKGEVLVYPYIIDSQGQKREVKPEAKIKADVWLVGNSEHYESYYKTYRTGNVLQTSRITLFGIEVYQNFKECQYLEYECEKSQVFLSKNQILPLKLEKIIYYELKTELVEQSFEEVKNDKLEEAKQKALTYLQECDIIKSEDVTINSGGGIYNVNYILTVEREIGEINEDIH